MMQRLVCGMEVGERFGNLPAKATNQRFRATAYTVVLQHIHLHG